MLQHNYKNCLQSVTNRSLLCMSAYVLSWASEQILSHLWKHLCHFFPGQWNRCGSLKRWSPRSAVLIFLDFCFSLVGGGGGWGGLKNTGVSEKSMNTWFIGPVHFGCFNLCKVQSWWTELMCCVDLLQRLGSWGLDGGSLRALLGYDALSVDNLFPKV